MLIKNLPKEIQEVVFKRQEEQGNPKNDKLTLNFCKDEGNFNWDETEEGDDFWEEINDGNFDVFYEKYPKKEASMFKKGDYIVCLSGKFMPSDDWNNICFQQRVNDSSLRTAIDLEGSATNGWDKIKFQSDLWRYASPEEIAEYDRLGKPYNVTTLKKQKEESLIGRYIKALKDYPDGGLVKKNEIGLIDKLNYCNYKVDFPSQKNYSILETLDTDIYELLPKDYKPLESKPMTYEHSPFPTDGNYFKAKVIKDIIRKDIGTKGSLPDIIPAGSITWFDKGYDYYNFIKNQENISVCPENNRYSANIPAEYFEIIEETSMKEIQEECKKRFPIGCKYISTAGSGAWILSKDDTVYSIFGNYIYASENQGCLYSDGKYAELVSLPESKSEIKLEKDKYYRLKFNSTFFIDKIKSIDCNEGTFDSYGYIDINRKNWINPDEYSIISDVKECYPATQDEIDWWNICYKKDKYISSKSELIEEAKRRYPIGTKFYPAHLNQKEYCIITNNNFQVYYGNNINVYALTESGKQFASISDIEYTNGNSYSRNVYYDDKWADTVQEKSVEPIVESKNDYIDVGFKIGDRVIGWGKEGIILGFTKDKGQCVIKITDGSAGHYGDGLNYWYDDYGLPINYYKNNKDKYYVSTSYLKKLPDSNTPNISQEQYITDIKQYPTTSNQSFLIHKSKTSLDTTVQKVSEISIELKQKSKTIKF